MPIMSPMRAEQDKDNLDYDQSGPKARFFCPSSYHIEFFKMDL